VAKATIEGNGDIVISEVVTTIIVESITQGPPGPPGPPGADMPFDDYTSSEYLEDQISTGAILTFTFSADVHQIWAVIDGANTDIGRIATGTTIPTATIGAPLFDATPLPLTVTTNTVNILAPIDAIVSVWGFRR